MVCYKIHSHVKQLYPKNPCSNQSVLEHLLCSSLLPEELCMKVFNGGWSLICASKLLLQASTFFFLLICPWLDPAFPSFLRKKDGSCRDTHLGPHVIRLWTCYGHPMPITRPKTCTTGALLSGIKMCLGTTRHV